MARWQEPMALEDLDQRRAPVNAKRHDEPGIAASLGRFGFIEALVLDERTGALLGGHGRLDQLMERHDAGEVPPEGVEIGDAGEWLVPVQRGWTSRDAAEAAAAAVALNRLVERGGWDERALLDQLQPFRENGGLAGTGYTSDDLAQLSAVFASAPSAPATEVKDRVPPVPSQPQTTSGDLWLLGRHRLLCGDATYAGAVEKLFGGKNAEPRAHRSSLLLRRVAGNWTVSRLSGDGCPAQANS